MEKESKPISAKLVRALSDGIDTLGVLILLDADGHILFSCETLELPFLDNQHNISCIPVGTYQIAKVNSSRIIPYPHFIVLNVAGREGIAIHVGNTAKDTKGCILVGQVDETITEHQYAEIIKSHDTLVELLATTPESFILEISDYKEEE